MKTSATISIVAVMVAALAFVFLRREPANAPDVSLRVSVGSDTVEKRHASKQRREAGPRGAVLDEADRKEPQGDIDAAGSEGAVLEATSPGQQDPDETPAEKSMREWGTFVESVREPLKSGVIDTKRQMQVRDMFKKLAPDDRNGAIHEALNLIPDENFSLLYGLLFDKELDAETLDTIFSDALNRDDEVKMPLLEEIAKDKLHPMFFESARILDVVKPEALRNSENR